MVIATVILLFLIICLILWRQTIQWNVDSLSVFKTMLISIILEAIPFLLIGIIVSAILQAFVPDAWIKKLIPKNPLAGVLIASLLGIIFPICECGLIPVVRRLVAKGMPLYAAITFILAGPIVNPVVYSATLAAFSYRPELVWLRMGLAIISSAVIGLIVFAVIKYNPLKTNNTATETCSHNAVEEGITRKSRAKSPVAESMEHATGEFFDMGKYLIMGSFLTAAIQAFVPRAELLSIGQGEVSSHLFMMGFAFILSLCSTSDAFVAASFLSTFSASSILTFLVFGPMLDLKGIFMLLSAFKGKFVLFLSITIAIVVLVFSLLLGHLFL